MKNLAIVYGGDSCERDISIITAIQLMHNINPSKYKFYAVMQTGGEFYWMKSWEGVDNYISYKPNPKDRVFFQRDGLYKQTGRCRKLASIDCVVLCNHGGDGENGTLQGYFCTLGLPITSPNVCASAIGMNKYLSKLIFRSLGCNVVDGVLYESGQNLQYSIQDLTFPLIVKPNCQGSSIGISTAHDMGELAEAVEIATQYDSKVVIEQALTNFVEINVALMRKGDQILVSSPEQPLNWQEFLSFEDKYISTGKMNGGGRIYPAQVEPKLWADIEYMAKKIYTALDMSGVVRMDFLTTQDGAYINEINTIPGSMAYYLFAEQGLDYEDIIDSIVEQSVKDNVHRPTAQYLSNVLSSYHTYSNACKKATKIL